MLSLVQLLTVLFAMVAVSHGEDKASDSKLESKWFAGPGFGGGLGGFSSYSFSSSSFYSAYNYMSLPFLNNYGFFDGGANCFGFGMLPYSPALFLKVDDAHSVTRRAVTLDSDRLYQRSQDSVTCSSAKGTTGNFVPSECKSAATKLAEQKLSTATCGKCTLTLVTEKNKVAPKNVPAKLFEQAAEGILKTCSSGKDNKQIKNSASSSSPKKGVVMVLSQSATATAC